MNMKVRKFPISSVSALVALAFAAPIAAYAASTPYGGTPIALPANIPAVNFDKGGEGAGYHDLTAPNLGGLYRASEGVDIYASGDTASGPYQVQNFQTGEWMAYTVSTATNANYDIAIRVSNNWSANCAFHIEVDGVNVSGSIKVPLTGSWTTYQPVGKTAIAMSAGTHVVKIVSDSQWFNVSALNIALSATQPASTGTGGTTTGGTTTGGTTSGGTTAPAYAGTPYSGTPIALPVAFPAANFDKGGQGVAYKDMTTGNAGGLFRTSEDVDIFASTDTAGGAYQVTNFQTGEWMNYTVNVPANGNYDLSVHASNNWGTSPAFHIEVDGKDVTGSVKVPQTGSWGTYQWAGKQGVPLTAGKHVLKLVSDAQWFNVSAVSVLASAGTTTGGTTTGGTTTGGTTTGGTTTGGTTTGGTTTGGTTTGGTTTGGTTTGGTTTGGTTTGGSTTGSTSATPPSSLLFWSGFDGFTPSAPADCWGNGCWQDVTGKDTVTGFTWPPVMNGGNGRFQLLSNPTAGAPASTSNIGNYMSNVVQTVTGHKGNSTQALLSTITQSGCCGTGSQAGADGSTQDPFIVFPNTDVKEGYVSQWIKLQPDLATKLLAGDSWRELFEIKTVNTDWRMTIGAVDWAKTGTPVWQVQTDSYVPSYHEFWRVYSTGAVPAGRWFKLEVYWKRSSGSDGRVWVAVDGQVIADKAGANMGPQNGATDRIMINQLYSGGSYPIYQWTDDLQIWSTFPTATSGNAWYDPPYAPH